MRIISGEYRRRRLHPLPKGVETRPIPDMVKEALFNLLRGHFEDMGVIDVFSGSGSVGLEAASQGASRVVCVERDRRMVKTLEDNIAMLGCEDRVEVACCDALGPATLSRCPQPLHIAFMDPPYAMVRDAEDWPRIQRQFERLIGMLDETGYAIVRTPWPLYRRELIEDEEEEGGVGDQKGVKKKKKAGGKGGGKADGRVDMVMTEMIEGEEMVEIDFDDVEGLIAGSVAGSAAGLGADKLDEDDGGKPRYETFDISLEMEGALGPETHVYGSTALHIYMRKP